MWCARLWLIIGLVIFLTYPSGVFGHRILGIFPLHVRSHMNMFEQMMKGLARRGHQVDVVSKFPQKKRYPNYTDIGITNSISIITNNLNYNEWGKMREDLVDFCVTIAGNDVCEAGLDSPEIQKLIQSPPNDPPYDLVITEVLCANCFMAFGHHLKVPVIGMSSCVMYPFNHDVVANPENLAFVPNNLIGHMENMNLWNRIHNVLNTIYSKIYYNYYTSMQTDLVRKHFGPDTPSIRELEQNLELVLVNSHFSLTGVKPNTPAHIEVGGLHIQDDDTEIPAKHKKWLDESGDGFIYFTFGSMVTIETLPKNILKNIFKSLRKISPVRILMKVPQPELLPPDVPENIKTFDWIPQLKVLKHKNIRAFLTHGGLMSTQEAIYCGVPMIGVPLFADQFLNIDRYVHRKLAIRVDFDNLSEEKLDAALHEILNNPIYRNTVKEVSQKFLDRPLSAMDTACYWVEYILRHGSGALRSPALDMTWWQLALLDVYCILMIAVGNISECCGYRILGIFPLNMHSHMMMFEQLMKGLAKRGHQVDVISTFPQKTPYPNYTDIVIPSVLPGSVNNVTYSVIREAECIGILRYMTVVMGNNICKATFTYPEIQNLISSPPKDPPYDLVITEVYTAHCHMIFGHHLKVPVVGVSSSALYPWAHDFVANSENLAFVSNNFIGFIETMSFPDRLYNVIHNIYAKLLFNYYTASQNDIIEKYFGPDLPNIRELERGLALILSNSHMSLHGVKPTTPALVEVGGLHIQDDDATIPEDHQKWMDESVHGFIYFTLGSMLNIESFPKPMLQNIFESFGKISPVRVFMKVPHPKILPPGLPKNVRTFVWILQLKVLKHKNIRAFITHGGLMSTQEAVACAVPMIGMPMLVDQFTNIDLYVTKKIAVRVDYHDLTTAKFDAALNEVLNNPMYRKMAREVSEKFLDRPLSPLDEACYWVEYVIRHGSKSLRSPALDFSWWQIDLLDVYAFLIIGSIGVIGILFTLIRFLIDIVCRSSSTNYLHKKFN